MPNDIEESKVSPQKSFSSYKSFEIATAGYENHSFINITGNEDFHAQAEAKNWPGTGTPVDPYVIDGYFVEEFIHISKTDVYFQISNCLLDASIELSNVTNSHICNNLIYRDLVLFDSDDNILANNNLTGRDTGIGLDNSNHNFLSNNIITGHHARVGFDHSNYNLISNNIITGEDARVGFDHSNHSLISSNNFIRISLSDSTNNTLLNNTIPDFSLSRSGSNRIIKNKLNIIKFNIYDNPDLKDLLQTEVINNTMNGKSLLYWQNITGETLPNGLGGYVLVNCTNIKITNQTLFGGVCAFSSNIKIQNNTFQGTVIYSYHSDSIAVASNIFENSSIWLYNTNNSILIENIRNSSFVTKTYIFTFGIRISSSENVSLIKNSVTGIITGIIQRSGVSIGEVSNILILNNTIGPIIHEAPHLFDDAQPRGISLGSFSNATIIGNTFVGNYKGLSVFNCTSESKVLYNNFIENYKHVTEAKCGLRVLFAYNFYDNWRSPDVDEDGIVDDPYLVFDDIFDYFPLVDPVTDFTSYFPLSPRVILPHRKEVLISEPLLISWIPALDLQGQSISYSVFYNADNDDLDWILIAAQLKETEYLWDLNSSLQIGMVFRIKVEAAVSEGLTLEYITDEYVIVEKYSNRTSISIEPILGIIIIYAMRRRKKKSHKTKSTKINERLL
jgi:parallel beta-helix repeat protein